MATQSYGARAAADAGGYAEVRGAGWLSFAGILLGLAGTWSVIDGILALSNSKVYGVYHTYVFSNLRTWGWIALFLGIALILAAFAIFAGSQFARWFGVAAASVNAIGQLAWIPVYPWWGLMLFAIDIAVIYGLVVYGGQDLRDA